MFELPVVAPSNRAPSIDDNVNPTQVILVTKKPTFPPTLRPSPSPIIVATDPSPSPVKFATDPSPYQALTPPLSSAPTSPQRPTGSPVELSDVTVYNNGALYVIDSESSSFVDESIVVTKNTTLVLQEGGYIEAPLNTDWPGA